MFFTQKPVDVNTRYEKELITYRKEQFVILKLLPIFKMNVFEFYVHRQV